MTLFSEDHFGNYSYSLLKSLIETIDNTRSIDTVEKTVAELIEKYNLPKLKFEDKGYQTVIEIETVPVDHWRGEYSSNGYKNIAVVKYLYEVEYMSREQKTLGLRPSIYTDNNYLVALGEKNILFRIPTKYSDENLPNEIINEVRQKREDILKYINLNIEYLNADIDRHNGEVKRLAQEHTQNRKKYLDQVKDVRSKL
jgi:hypothetical protein